MKSNCAKCTSLERIENTKYNVTNIYPPYLEVQVYFCRDCGLIFHKVVSIDDETGDQTK